MTEDNQILVTLHGTATFDSSGQREVERSISNALDDLSLAAKANDGKVMWSTVEVMFRRDFIQEQAITATHPRIVPGRSTVHATAEVLI